MEPRSEYPRPRFQRPDWINLNGEWEFGAGDRPTFDRRTNRLPQRLETFPGLGPDWLRLSVRDRRTNERVLAAFSALKVRSLPEEAAE